MKFITLYLLTAFLDFIDHADAAPAGRRGFVDHHHRGQPASTWGDGVITKNDITVGPGGVVIPRAVTDDGNDANAPNSPAPSPAPSSHPIDDIHLFPPVPPNAAARRSAAPPLPILPPIILPRASTPSGSDTAPAPAPQELTADQPLFPLLPGTGLIPSTSTSHTDNDNDNDGSNNNDALISIREMLARGRNPLGLSWEEVQRKFGLDGVEGPAAVGKGNFMVLVPEERCEEMKEFRVLERRGEEGEGGEEGEEGGEEWEGAVENWWCF